MHKKDLGIPRRQNGIPVKKKKAKTELSKHQKQERKKHLPWKNKVCSKQNQGKLDGRAIMKGGYLK